MGAIYITVMAVSLLVAAAALVLSVWMLCTRRYEQWTE